MKVVHYNTYAGGGAAVVMLRLHHALRDAGVDSFVRCRSGSISGDDSEKVEYCRGWLDRQRERVRYRLENMWLVAGAPSYFSRLHLHRPTPLLKADLDADIVHVHWIGRWLDLRSFLQSVPQKTPIVWTIHDMSPLAGGCFTYSGCDHYQTGCRKCPILKYPFSHRIASNEFSRRLKALDGRDLYVVGNSRHTTDLARKSGLFHSARGIVTIHPAVDTAQFVQHGKAEVRRLLGIPETDLVLGFGAASLTDANKGFARFAEVAATVGAGRTGTTALIFGDGMTSAQIPNVRTVILGSLSAAVVQSLAYSAMDVFVLASQMESFGQVAIEAQSCGVPVWAFDVGGVSDAVDSGCTGHLVTFGDCIGMAEGILAAATGSALDAMAVRCRDWVKSRFSTEDATQKYLNLYHSALRS